MGEKLPFSVFLFFIIAVLGQDENLYRPQYHYSVEKNWLNDPNGLIYLDGEYHMYYQYHPVDNSPNGPKHWAHTVSTDLVKWTDLPVAIYPDEVGHIWSGSAIADFTNSTGFQTGENTVIVAIFTSTGVRQQQSIAYSNDKGVTFTMYEGNPVIPNDELADFRDPKVFRYNDSWFLVLAASNRVMFYTSQDLKTWEYLSDFGSDPEQGSHGGVWECPDFFWEESIQMWVLTVSISGGHPNWGSGTQYFPGHFNGFNFTSDQIQPAWVEYGVDNYAGISFTNEPDDRRIVIGWMTNLVYAGSTPTIGWRGQMTLPRELTFSPGDNGLFKISVNPILELSALVESRFQFEQNTEILADQILDISAYQSTLLHLQLVLDTEQMKDGGSISICFLNELMQEVCMGYDKGREDGVFLDRTRSGRTDFSGDFSRRASAPRHTNSSSLAIEIYLDNSAVELFVDKGLTTMNALFYPDVPYTKAEIRNHAQGNADHVVLIKEMTLESLKSMKFV